MEDVKKDNQVKADPFTRMMFGSRNEDKETMYHQPSLDFEELMVSIDTLIDSAKNLKPLFQKVLPVIEQLWKKG
jgi:hypothetical protein